MKKIINIIIWAIAILTLLSIMAMNIYSIFSRERDYKQHSELLESLEQYNESWDEIKESLKRFDQQ